MDNPSQKHALESIREHVFYLRKELRRWENTLRYLSGEREVITPLFDPSEINRIKAKKTFDAIILEILHSEGQALTRSDLLNIYNTMTGKGFDVSTFSGQLSPMVSKKKIIKIEFPKNIMTERFKYGIPKWYEDDLKEK